MDRRVNWAAAGLILLLAGCGAESGQSVDTGADPRESIQGTWYPQRIAGYSVDPLYEKSFADAYLKFDDGDWNGSDGCNGMSGTYELQGDGAFDLKGGASTEIGCANVPHYDVMDAATRVVIDGDTLVFSSTDTQEIARYTRARNPAPTTSSSSPKAVDPAVPSERSKTQDDAVKKVLGKSEPAIPPGP